MKKGDGLGVLIVIALGVVGLAWSYHPLFGIVALGLILWLTRASSKPSPFASIPSEFAICLNS
jgi:hypothetical protein